MAFDDAVERGKGVKPGQLVVFIRGSGVG